jgi:hypothetical protein
LPIVKFYTETFVFYTPAIVVLATDGDED